MDAEELRLVEDLSLNDVWNHEEHGFTPWLVDHIDRLEEAIGIEIDSVEREDSVGGYTADITGKELNTDGNVVIENQFGDTDHNHLGQLLTYAAGIDAEFVIWLSESFRDEHRSVLEWMNNSNSGGIMFFGVRPRVIKLQDADELGFEFDIVVEPNDWERELRDSVSTREKAYKEFFAELTNESQSITSG
ncbi:hypothetical protein [Halomicrobium katesii]|uniref:hypothetical protein n=1 Tax=Halomicrobium katesii TaxID=437163 RepID=UPI0003605E9C|nr:hypothetical protein [Halomicrobium katesii]